MQKTHTKTDNIANLKIEFIGSIDDDYSFRTSYLHHVFYWEAKMKCPLFALAVSFKWQGFRNLAFVLS